MKFTTPKYELNDDKSNIYLPLHVKELTNKDIYFIADKKTGIFHSRSCKKMGKDLIYYANAKVALVNGYIPCFTCKPIIEDETPNARRHYDLNQDDYERIIRINKRFGTINIHENKNLPQPTHDTIVISKLYSPLGIWLVGATHKGICLFQSMEKFSLEKQLKKLESLYNARLVSGYTPLFEQLNQELNEYFLGQRKAFNIPLDIKGTAFQESVWKVLLSIPYGKVISYKEEALDIGNPKGVRAVANANANNRISILIPCHRVIGHNGKMVGYGGKIWRKEYLLQLENKHSLHTV